MSKATYWQRGEALDYANTTNAIIPANTIVSLPSVIGIVGTDINPGETGSLLVEGVFIMPKTANAAIPMGTTVYFDGTGITTTANNNVVAGFAAADAAAGDENIYVKING